MIATPLTAVTLVACSWLQFDSTLEDLKVFERVLDQRLTQEQEHIAPEGAELRYSEHVAGAPSSALELYADLQGVYYRPSNFSVRSAYLPDIGAIFFLEANLRTMTVQPTEKHVNGSGAADTSLWEQCETEVRSGRPTIETNFWGAISRDQDEVAIERRYDPQALAHLENTILETFAQYGHHIDLPEHERIAVYIRLKGQTSGGNLVSGVTTSRGVFGIDEFGLRSGKVEFAKDEPKQLVIHVAKSQLRAATSAEAVRKNATITKY